MTVVSDISVLAKQSLFNDETNMLSLGPVRKAEGREVPLHFSVKGKYKEEVEFSVAEIDPEGILSASVGSPKKLTKTNADGEKEVTTLLFPLKIAVEKNSKSVQRMGSVQGDLGTIKFNTNHPEIPTFSIRVQFAVQ